MNTNEPNPSTPPVNPASSKPAPGSGGPRPWQDPFALESMPEAPTALNAIASLLKVPGRVLFQLSEPGGGKLALGLFVCLVVCLLTFGLLLGTFNGGTQLWAAPAKVLLGTFASALICLPSLVIFALLGGADCSITKLGALLLTMLALMGLLLVGFAPVIWVFAQSSSAVGFMGALGIAFWMLSWGFGLRMLTSLARNLGSRSKGALLAWGCIFLLVTFQMTSTLRPILGTSDTFLPQTKLFFLENWMSDIGLRNG